MSSTPEPINNGIVPTGADKPRTYGAKAGSTIFSISVDMSGYNAAVARLRESINKAAASLSEPFMYETKKIVGALTKYHETMMENAAWYRKAVERMGDPKVKRGKAKALARSIRNNEPRRTKLVRSRRKKSARLRWKRLRERG